MVGPVKNVESRILGPLMPSDVAKWEKETEKTKKKPKSIEVDDQLPNKFAKILTRLWKGKFLA